MAGLITNQSKNSQSQKAHGFREESRGMPILQMQYLRSGGLELEKESARKQELTFRLKMNMLLRNRRVGGHRHLISLSFSIEFCVCADSRFALRIGVVSMSRYIVWHTRVGARLSALPCVIQANWDIGRSDSGGLPHFG